MSIAPSRLRPANSNEMPPRLEDVCPLFRDKMRQFRLMADYDTDKAADIFASAQEVGKAFWAGVEYACGAEL